MRKYRNMEIQNITVTLNSGTISVPGRGVKNGGFFLVQDVDIASPDLVKKVSSGTVRDVTIEAKEDIPVEKERWKRDVEDHAELGDEDVVHSGLRREYKHSGHMIVGDVKTNTEGSSDNSLQEDVDRTADILTNSPDLIEIGQGQDEDGDQSSVQKKKKKRSKRSSGKN
jgi:hypothetical protein